MTQEEIQSVVDQLKTPTLMVQVGGPIPAAWLPLLDLKAHEMRCSRIEAIRRALMTAYGFEDPIAAAIAAVSPAKPKATKKNVKKASPSPTH